MLNDGKARGEERRCRQRADLERAVYELERRRRSGEYVFRSTKMALLWYFERASTICTARSIAITTQQDYLGQPHLIVVDGGEPPDPEEILVTLFTIEVEYARYAALHPYKARAVELCLRNQVTQEDAGRRLNVDQSTISRWIGECEAEMLPMLREAGVVR